MFKLRQAGLAPPPRSGARQLRPVLFTSQSFPLGVSRAANTRCPLGTPTTRVVLPIMLGRCISSHRCVWMVPMRLNLRRHASVPCAIAAATYVASIRQAAGWWHVVARSYAPRVAWSMLDPRTRYGRHHNTCVSKMPRQPQTSDQEPERGPRC